MRARLALYVALVAGLLTVCDWACHVRQGVLSYGAPIVGELLPGQPTPAVYLLFFTCAALGVAIGWPRLRLRPAPGPAKTLLHVVVFVATYYASGLFADHPLGFALACVGVWQAQVALNERRGELIAASLLLALAGTLIEALVASTGFFAYARPDLLGVPIWLPGLYLVGAPAALATLAELAALHDREPA